MISGWLGYSYTLFVLPVHLWNTSVPERLPARYFRIDHITFYTFSPFKTLSIIAMLLLRDESPALTAIMSISSWGRSFCTESPNTFVTQINPSLTVAYAELGQPLLWWFPSLAALEKKVEKSQTWVNFKNIWYHNLEQHTFQIYNTFKYNKYACIMPWY